MHSIFKEILNDNSKQSYIMNFFTEYDQLAADVSKFIRTKKSTIETAALFGQLVQKVHEDNPFEAALAGLAHYGALQCYERLEDKYNIINHAVKAARLFLKTAEYNYLISKTLRETWIDHLADALECYKVAIDLLKLQNKIYLASQLMLEVGNTQLKFDLKHQAAETFEETTEIIIQGHGPLPLLFNALISAITSYNKIDRFDLGLILIEKCQPHFFDNEEDWASPPPVMKRQFQDLLIFHCQLLLMNFRFDQCLSFAQSNFDADIIDIFTRMVYATQNHQVTMIDSIIEEASNNSKFSASHISQFRRHLTNLSHVIENSVSLVLK